MTATETDWQIRHYIYEVWRQRCGPPDVDAIASRFALPKREALAALRRLHEAHALVLQANREDILMAHPFSAVPTDYRVTVGEKSFYANCAWDSLGIPAALNSDATIVARHPVGRDIIRYAVRANRLAGGGLVHFARPFRQWYEDIVDT